MQKDWTLVTLTLSLGTLLMVFSGRNTLSTLRDLMVLRFFPAEPLSLLLEEEEEEEEEDVNSRKSPMWFMYN